MGLNSTNIYTENLGAFKAVNNVFTTGK